MPNLAAGVGLLQRDHSGDCRSNDSCRIGLESAFGGEDLSFLQAPCYAKKVPLMVGLSYYSRKPGCLGRAEETDI